MITVAINGKERALEGPTPLVAFLEATGVNPQFVAVAYNGDVLQREDFQRIVIKEGDVLEIVRPVGGG